MPKTGGEMVRKTVRITVSSDTDLKMLLEEAQGKVTEAQMLKNALELGIRVKMFQHENQGSPVEATAIETGATQPLLPKIRGNK